MRLKNISLSFGSTIFKALSEEARVRIISLMLENKEMCISDLELVLDFTQAKTSRHVTFLKNAGMLTSRRVDQWILYQVKDEIYDITDQMLRFIRKDQRLEQDINTYNVMLSNRELAAYKLQRHLKNL